MEILLNTMILMDISTNGRQNIITETEKCIKNENNK